MSTIEQSVRPAQKLMLTEISGNLIWEGTQWLSTL
ncbi:hypothetical protein XHC_4481 [Xanthomonas hortorum pv. carotae str. M081]|nr:hypothetical protein XHC_4481 [Xanthomonas hortorum pv. carotae str. M081]